MFQAVSIHDNCKTANTNFNGATLVGGTIVIASHPLTGQAKDPVLQQANGNPKPNSR